MVRSLAVGHFPPSGWPQRTRDCHHSAATCQELPAWSRPLRAGLPPRS